MTAAFKEYVGIEMDQSKEKPSVRKKLQKTKERKSKTTSEVKQDRKSEDGTMIRGKDAEYPDEESGDIKHPYLIIFYLADKCFWLYRHCMGRSMIEKICVMLMNFPLAFANWFRAFIYKICWEV